MMSGNFLLSSAVTRSSSTMSIAAMMPKLKRPLTTAVRSTKEKMILWVRGDLNSIVHGLQAVADAVHCVQKGGVERLVNRLAQSVYVAAQAITAGQMLTP